MDDILTAGIKLKWSEKIAGVDEIQDQYGFPQIVKTSAKTSADYNLPEGEPVMLLSKRKPVRLIAQTIEEGHYVMGKQVEIPSEYSGLFKMYNEFERDDTPLETFTSIQEVANASPAKVYVQDYLTVTHPFENPSSQKISLQKGDELTLIPKSQCHSNQAKTGSSLLGKSWRPQNVVDLSVHCTRLNKNLSIPLSTKGSFSTKPPLLLNLKDNRGMVSLQHIMEKANFPLTVTVVSNSSRSVKDEFPLRIGMHLKLIGLEEHDIVLAITPFQRIVEFSVKEATFLLPSFLTTRPQLTQEDGIAELNEYHTYLQSAYMNSKLQNSPSNIEEYCTAVRYHIPRNIRPTKPTPLNSNASFRFLLLSPSQQKERMYLSDSSKRLSSFQILSNQQRGIRDCVGLEKRNSVPTELTTNPPLPPRNPPPLPPTSSSVNSTQPAPPVPRKSRAPPIPPLPYTIEQAPAAPPLSCLPKRPAPKPNISKIQAEQAATRRNEENNNDSQSSRKIDEERNSEEYKSQIYPQLDTFRAAPPIRLEDQNSPHVSHPSQSRYEDSSSGLNTTLPPAPVSKDFSSGTESQSRSHFVEGGTCNSGTAPPTLKRDEAVVVNGNDSSPSECVYSHAEDVTVAAPVQQSESEKLPIVRSRDNDDNVASSEASQQASNVAEIKVNSRKTPLVTERITRNVTRHRKDKGSSTPQRAPKNSYISSPADWTPPDDISTLSVKEVAVSMRYIGMNEETVRMFINEKIDGSMLVELNEEILEQDFGLSRLYCLKIKRFVEGWRPKQPPTNT